MFRKVVYYSGGLYGVQVGYMLSRWVIRMLDMNWESTGSWLNELMECKFYHVMLIANKSQ